MAPSWVSASIVAARLEGYRQAVLQMMPIAKCVMGSSSCLLPTGTRPDAIPPTTAPSANGVRIDESAKTVSTALRSRAAARPGAQRVGDAAEDDPDPRR